MLVFFVRFLVVFIIALGLIVGALFYFRPTFAMMKSPAEEKVVLQSIYTAQNKGAEARDPGRALGGAASYCIFVDGHGHVLPVPPMQQKLAALYKNVTQVKATSDITGIKIVGDKATVTAANQFSCRLHGTSPLVVSTTTRDVWEKLVGRWSCYSCKIVTSNHPKQGFVVPH